MNKTAKRKPFATIKPRDQWRRPADRVRGRVVKAVDVGSPAVSPTAHEPVLKLHVFELRRDGLHVRRRGGRRKGETVLSFERLANWHKPQPELFA